MPTPLSSSALGVILLGNAGDRPLSRHPGLAVLALEAIASWSNVESFLMDLFVRLLGGSDSVATALYMALEAQSAKTAAIQAAAKAALKDRDEEYSVLLALLAIAKSNGKNRHKLAHWTWGDISTIPDALLLADSKKRKDMTFDIRTSPEQAALYVDGIYVYKEPDFTSIIQANDRLCGYLLEFSFVLMDHPANRGGKLLRQLLSQPEIQERVNLQALRDRSNTEGHP